MNIGTAFSAFSVVATVIACVTSKAEAALVFTFERSSYTEAKLSGTGSADAAAGPYAQLYFRGIIGNQSAETGNFQFGVNRNPFSFGYFSDGEAGFGLDGPAFRFTDADGPTGVAILTTLGSSGFPAVGTTGSVVAVTADAYLLDKHVVGTWRVIEPAIIPPPRPVPLPAALPLLGGALAVVGGLGWRGRSEPL